MHKFEKEIKYGFLLYVLLWTWNIVISIQEFVILCYFSENDQKMGSLECQNCMNSIVNSFDIGSASILLPWYIEIRTKGSQTTRFSSKEMNDN